MRSGEGSAAANGGSPFGLAETSREESQANDVCTRLATAGGSQATDCRTDGGADCGGTWGCRGTGLA